MRYFERSKLEAKEKQTELKSKLAEINSKVDELDSKMNELGEPGKEPENVETFLADYRLKLDQLEALIANLTATEFPKTNLETEKESNDSPKFSNWKGLIDSRLERVKKIIYKLAAYRPTTTTVTKYLPTSKPN